MPQAKWAATWNRSTMPGWPPGVLSSPQRPIRITVGRIASVAVGFLLVFSAPFSYGAFRNFLLPIFGSYRVTVFEALAIPVAAVATLACGFRIKRHEQLLFASILFIMVARVISLLAAAEFQPEQFVSVLRYGETLVLVYCVANLMQLPENRKYLLRGIFAAVTMETAGDIAIFLSGQGRGIFVSVNTFILQVFLITAWFLGLLEKRRRLLTTLGIVALLIGIVVTTTRSALILLFVTLFLLTVYKRVRMLKPVVMTAMVGLVIVLALALTPIFPQVADNVGERLLSDGSVIFRLHLWDLALATFLEHPLTGIGSGGFARQQDRLPYLFDVRISREYGGFQETPSAHNTVLSFAAETGAIGLAAYFLCLVAITRLCLKALRQKPNRPDIYVASAALCVLALLVADFWAQGSFIPESSTLLGLVMGWLRQTSGP